MYEVFIIFVAIILISVFFAIVWGWRIKINGSGNVITEKEFIDYFSDGRYLPPTTYNRELRTYVEGKNVYKYGIYFGELPLNETVNALHNYTFAHQYNKILEAYDYRPKQYYGFDKNFNTPGGRKLYFEKLTSPWFGSPTQREKLIEELVELSQKQLYVYQYTVEGLTINTHHKICYNGINECI